MPSGQSGRGWVRSRLVGRLDVKSVQLQARIGIATGLVVVGDLIGEGSAQEQSAASKLEKLEALLARAMPPDEDMAFLTDLLSLPASERHPLRNLSPQRKKERTLEALIRELEGLARQMPVVVVFEDAH